MEFRTNSGKITIDCTSCGYDIIQFRIKVAVRILDSRILHLLGFLKYLINTNSSRNNFKRYYCYVRMEYFFVCTCGSYFVLMCACVFWSWYYFVFASFHWVKFTSFLCMWASKYAVWHYWAYADLRMRNCVVRYYFCCTI